MQRYPENINVDIEDFRRSNWKSAIGSRDREGYSSMWQSLSAAARTAIEKGDIWPALEMMVLEHRIRESDFVALATRSPIVPAGRERLFGKALFAGYEKDFVAALHLLVPQIEHMVRWHLKAAGVKTTNLDQDGIENENGLSTLMDLPEAAQIFGEDVSFELKALFCDAFGPNLRNELAHGLLDDEACQSIYAIYAWWFGLRLVFNTFWNARRKAEAETDANNNA
jgi:hypothetical protein